MHSKKVAATKPQECKVALKYGHKSYSFVSEQVLSSSRLLFACPLKDFNSEMPSLLRVIICTIKTGKCT
jgi:hypothetical protein